MVDVKAQQGAPQPQLTGRQKARAARLKLIYENQTAATVQVYAGSEDIQGILKHPSGARLRGSFGSPTEWPYDAFTHRRILDGTLSLKSVKDSLKPDPKLGVREAAARRRPKPEDMPLVRPLSAMPKSASPMTAPKPPSP